MICSRISVFSDTDQLKVLEPPPYIEFGVKLHFQVETTSNFTMQWMYRNMLSIMCNHLGKKALKFFQKFKSSVEKFRVLLAFQVWEDQSIDADSTGWRVKCNSSKARLAAVSSLY